MSILPAQCRAARALIDMSQATLARRAVVPRDAIVDFENGSRTLTADNFAAIRAALEAAGVDENGDGPGVRLRKRHGLWDAGVVRRRLGERVKTTLCWPSRSGL